MTKKAGSRPTETALEIPFGLDRYFATWRSWLPKALVLLAAGLLAFSPSFRGVWIWDDAQYIRDNTIIHDPLGLWRIWSGYDVFGDYYPLTSFVEWVLWQDFGEMNLLPYHLTTIFLHLGNALLIWKLFNRLGLPFAWVGGLIFAVDPIMVESVAWISELKNTLSLFPLLVAMNLLLKWEKEGSAYLYRWALVCFTISLLAKSGGVMLPVVMLGYVWWRRGTITWNDVKVASPFFALSILISLIALYPHHDPNDPRMAQPDWSWASTFAGMGWTFFFLLGKCLLPVQLLPDYAGFYGKPLSPLDFLPWFSLACMAAMLWRARAGWGRHVLFGLGFFLVNLVPVFIFMFQRYTIMIWSLDHLVYLPIIGLIGLLIAGLGLLQKHATPRGRIAGAIALSVVITAMAYGSFQYSKWWADWKVLWTRTLEINPDSWLVRQNYGIVLGGQGRDREAIEQFQIAQQVRPRSAVLHFNIADSLKNLGDNKGAEAEYKESIKLQPDDPESYAKLGNLLVQMGRRNEAAAQYEAAIKIIPKSPKLHYNLGSLYLTAGNVSGALEMLQESVEQDPSIAPAHENLGSAFAQSNRLPEAIIQFQAAIDIDPNYVIARYNLGHALAQIGQIPEAIDQFKEVLVLDPDNAAAQQNLSKLQAFQMKQGAAAPK